VFLTCKARKYVSSGGPDFTIFGDGIVYGKELDSPDFKVQPAAITRSIISSINEWSQLKSIEPEPIALK
jgi:hypothetical protein